MRKKAILTQLNAAHGSALLEQCAVGKGEKVIFRGQERDLNDVIKEEMRLYLNTWVVNRIVFAIEEIQRDGMPKVVKQFVRKPEV